MIDERLIDLLLLAEDICLGKGPQFGRGVPSFLQSFLQSGRQQK
jgi:hypothetical protein